MGKKVWLTSLLLVFCFVIAYGSYYSNQKIYAKGQSAKIAFNREQQKEKEELKKKIDILSPQKGKQLSFDDFLNYKSLTQKSVTISVIGSSVTVGTGASSPSLSWAGKLAAKKVSNNNLKVINDGHSGYSTKDLIERNSIPPLINDKPDLVIFETSLLNDHGHSIPINNSLANINTIVNKIQSALPNTAIVLMSPNPSSAKLNQKNSIGVTYEEYLNASKQFITQKQWYYIDSYQGIQDELTANKTQLKDILFDGIHPNDTGYGLWYDVISNNFAQKRTWQ